MGCCEYSLNVLIVVTMPSIGQNLLLQQYYVMTSDAINHPVPPLAYCLLLCLIAVLTKS